MLPALSRHPSLKHLHLGKNFNIKNRCGRRHDLLQCACVLLQDHVRVPLLPGSAVSLSCPLSPWKRLLAPGSDLTHTPLHPPPTPFFVSLHRVLDEVLQKLVTLIQEEECVSEHPGNVHTSLHTHMHTCTHEKSVKCWHWICRVTNRANGKWISCKDGWEGGKKIAIQSLTAEYFEKGNLMKGNARA